MRHGKLGLRQGRTTSWRGIETAHAGTRCPPREKLQGRRGPRGVEVALAEGVDECMGRLMDDDVVREAGVDRLAALAGEVTEDETLELVPVERVGIEHPVGPVGRLAVKGGRQVVSAVVAVARRIEVDDLDAVAGRARDRVLGRY